MKEITIKSVGMYTDEEFKETVEAFSRGKYCAVL